MSKVMHYVPKSQFKKKDPLPVLCGHKNPSTLSCQEDLITCKRCNKLLESRIPVKRTP